MIEAIFRWILNNPKKVIVACIISSLFLGSFLRQLRIDPSVEALVLENDPARVNLTQFKRDFENDELILLAIATTDAFDKTFVAALRDLTQRIIEIPGVTDATSLTNADRMQGKNDLLIVGNLFDPIPEGNAFAKRIDEALATPLYLGDLFTKERNAATILIEVEDRALGPAPGTEENGEDEVVSFETAESSAVEVEEMRRQLLRRLHNEIKTMKDELRKQGAAIPAEHHAAGIFVIKQVMNEYIKKDNRLFIPLMILLMFILIYLAFRNIRFVWLPQVILTMTATSTVGLMAMFGVTLDVVTSFLTIVIVAISVADVVHILVRYFEELEHGLDKETALLQSLVHVAKPCFLTSITTLFGFLSLLYTDIAPIRHFGIFAGVGVSLALVYSLTLVPAVLSLVPKPTKSNLEHVHGAWMEAILRKMVRFNEKYKWAILAVAHVLVFVAIYGLFSVNVETVYRRFFKESTPVVKAINFLDERLAGSQTLELAIEALCHPGEDYQKHRAHRHDEETLKITRDRLKEPRILQEMEKTQDFLASITDIRKTSSIVDTIKEISKSMNPIGDREDMKYYILPKSKALISDYLFLYNTSAGSGKLDDMVDPDYTRARVSIRLAGIGSRDLIELIDRIKKFVAKTFSKDVRVAVTGNGVMFARTSENLLWNIIVGFFIAISLVVVTMTLIFRSIKLGALSILPNVFPIVFNFFVMYMLDIDLNISTAMIASISIGLVVDDTIHFFNRFREEYNRDGDHQQAIRRTLLTVGRAMGFTSFILASGFMLSAFSDFRSTIEFGVLMTVVTMVALLADLVLTSAVILIIKPRLRRSGGAAT